MIDYGNDGLGILTDWRFAIVKLKGKIFPVHAVKAEREEVYFLSYFTSESDGLDGHFPAPATLFQERSMVLVE